MSAYKFQLVLIKSFDGFFKQKVLKGSIPPPCLPLAKN